jgi:hypothetical protein
MAVNFGLLQPAQPASAFFQGQQDVQREAEQNMLRQSQMENMAAQRAERLAMVQDRQAMTQERTAKAAQAAKRQEFLAGLSAKMAEGGYKLDRPTLGQVLQFGMQTGEDSLIKLATEGMRALDEEDRYREEATRLGLPGAAPAPAAAPSIMRQPAAAPAAPTNMLAGTPFDIGVSAPAPANALAAPAGVTREMAQQMILSTNPRIREQGKALVGTLPKEPAAPAPTELSKLQREINALPPGDPLRAQLEARQRVLTQPQSTKVEVKLPEQEKAFESELGKGQAKKAIEDKAVAEDAKSIITTVQEGRRLLQSGVITGFGADFLTSAGAALNQAGINFAEDAVANTQAFTANMAANVGRIIKQFGAGTGLSNADREYAEMMAGGKVTLDRKAIERILDINERAARNVISLHNKNVSGIKTNVPLTVDVPSRLSPQDQQALDWANSNPRDPRAAQIKQRLGAQ